VATEKSSGSSTEDIYVYKWLNAVRNTPVKTVYLFFLFTEKMEITKILPI
jgi:hypothetical protein